MRQAQKMQKDLQKTQEELSATEYVGTSSFITIVLNGNKDLKSVKINCDDDLSLDDVEIIEDMFVAAFNDAAKKVDADKEKKLGKYGSGLSGLM